MGRCYKQVMNTTNTATIRPVAYSPKHLGAAYRVDIADAGGKHLCGATVANKGAAKTWAKRYGGAGVEIVEAARR